MTEQQNQAEPAMNNSNAITEELSDKDIKRLLEATLFVAEKPMSLDEILNTVLSSQQIGRQYLKDLIFELQQEYVDRGVQLIEVASGYRFQAVSEFSPFLSFLWQERVPKYSRALLETLALIAYRQPITRGEIEDVRGVAVSSNIIKTMQERDWIKVVGHKEVPGRPALFATTKNFLDYFGLKSLSELPALEEIQFTDEINADIELTSEQQEILAANNGNANETDNSQSLDMLDESLNELSAENTLEKETSND